MTWIIRSRTHDLIEDVLKDRGKWENHLNSTLAPLLLTLGGVMLSTESILVSLFCWVMFLAAFCASPVCMKELHAWRRGSPEEREIARMVSRTYLLTGKWSEPSPFFVSSAIFSIDFFHSMGFFAIGRHLPHWFPIQ